MRGNSLQRDLRDRAHLCFLRIHHGLLLPLRDLHLHALPLSDHLDHLHRDHVQAKFLQLL